MRLFVRTPVLLLFVTVISVNAALSQISLDTLTCFTEVGSLISTGKSTPFWLFSNHAGVTSNNPPVFAARAGISGKLSFRPQFSFTYGIDVNSYLGKTSHANFQQAYGKLKLGFVSFNGGLWEEVHGNQDSTLSSGGLLWSGNAPPIPKIGIEIPGYTRVPLTKGFLKFRGGIYHGWLRDNIYYEDTWLHHKFVYFQLGGHYPVHIEYGLHHFAQWGGISSLHPGLKLPHDLSTFFKVLNGRGMHSGAPDTEINAIGNHLGSNNFAISFTKRPLAVSIYWQTIFEDGSGMKFQNIRDGLWGLKVNLDNKRLITGVLFEFINTTHQSGPVAAYYVDSTLVIASGNDNYFNNGLYGAGWTNRGITIGTPLITSPVLLSEWPYPYVNNNKVTALHCGITGEIGMAGYTLLYTFSRNQGTNDHPYPQPRKQHSFMLRSVLTNITPLQATVSVTLALDMGDLLDNNAGIYISFRKEGLISRIPKKPEMQ